MIPPPDFTPLEKELLRRFLSAAHADLSSRATPNETDPGCVIIENIMNKPELDLTHLPSDLASKIRGYRGI